MCCPVTPAVSGESQLTLTPAAQRQVEGKPREAGSKVTEPEETGEGQWQGYPIVIGAVREAVLTVPPDLCS